MVTKVDFLINATLLVFNMGPRYLLIYSLDSNAIISVKYHQTFFFLGGKHIYY
jgi:hypothetical protein